MAESATDEQAIHALQRLPRVLLELGYWDAHLVFGWLSAEPRKQAAGAAALPSPLRELIQLFAGGRAVPVSGVVDALGAADTEGLLRLGALIAQGDAVHSGGLALVPAFEHLVFMPMSGGSTARYLGDDMAAMAVRVSPPAGARCLDLFSGVGVVALRLSGRASSVVAVELDPLAAGCADLNATMNGLEGRVEVRSGRLFEPVGDGEAFDYVSAAPPLLPVPSALLTGSDEPAADDSDSILRELLDGLPGVLVPGGSAQLVGASAGGEDGPAVLERLVEWAPGAGFRVHLTLPSRSRLRPGGPMFEALGRQCAAAAAVEIPVMRARLAAHFAAVAAGWLYPFYATLVHAPERAGVTHTQHFIAPGGFWFRK